MAHMGTPVRRVAVVGTGVIGASWAAWFLAQGLDVDATDPSPGAEARLREEPGGPAGADHAGADHRDASDGRAHVRHLRTRP